MTDVCFRKLTIGQQKTVLIKGKMRCDMCWGHRNLSIHCVAVKNQVDHHPASDCDPIVLCSTCHRNACPLARNMEK